MLGPSFKKTVNGPDVANIDDPGVDEQRDFTSQIWKRTTRKYGQIVELYYFENNI